MDKFYMEKDSQYDYDPDWELYHVFEHNRFNEFNEPYCVAPFLSYDEALKLTNQLNAKTRQLANHLPKIH